MNTREDTGSRHTHADHEHETAGGCCGGKSASGCGSGGGGGGCCGGASTSAEQIHVFSRRQIRELDRLAVEEFAMPSILLMENAARGISGVILEGIQGIEDPSALIICGPGNNGGDGLAVARHLANRGVKLAVVLASKRAPSASSGELSTALETSSLEYTGDALINLRIVQKMNLPIFDSVAAAIAAIGEPVVVVDALLGTGLDRPATGVMAELITQMNSLKSRGSTLVAIDVPSGLDADTGEPGTDATGSGPAVEADLTIALAGIKAGFLSSTAQKHVGELVVVEIGVPRELVARLGRPLTAPKMG